MQSTVHKPTIPVAAFTLLSWLGGYIHNRLELPQLTLLSPENSLPALVSALLFLAWWRLPFGRATTVALLTWAVIQCIGGSLSVIPFAFWPYSPAQTLEHYAAHMVYAVAQVPLLVALIRHMTFSPATEGHAQIDHRETPETH